MLPSCLTGPTHDASWLKTDQLNPMQLGRLRRLPSNRLLSVRGAIDRRMPTMRFLNGLTLRVLGAMSLIAFVAFFATSGPLHLAFMFLLLLSGTSTIALSQHLRRH